MSRNIAAWLEHMRDAQNPATLLRRSTASKEDDFGRLAIVEARRLTAALSASLQTEGIAPREEGRDLRLLLTLLELWRAERNEKKRAVAEDDFTNVRSHQEVMACGLILNVAGRCRTRQAIL